MKTREKKIWKLDGRSKDAPVLSHEEAARKKYDERNTGKKQKKYASDPLAFYRDIIARESRDKGTGLLHRKMLGEIHKFLMDFLCLEMPGVKRYSALQKYLPPQTNDGGYEERWLYWPTLASEPLIQDGPVGELSKMFQEKPWQGLVIRLRGILDKAVLIPRGHLKSALCTELFTLWKMIRDPADRHQINSAKQPLARKFMGAIKFHFEKNDAFKALYGHLKPDKRDSAWNADFIQLNSDARRGKDPTLEVVGLGSDSTGTHYDDIMFDDLVTMKNTGGEMTEKTNEQIMMLNAIRDPGSTLLDIGTPYEEGDGHSLFTRPDGSFYEDSSFFVATMVDSNPEGVIPAHLTIAGPGNPIWPEKFTLREVGRRRRAHPIDRQYFGQYFCQFTGTSEKLFHQDWIQYYEERPEDLAVSRKCNLFIGIDTASGKIVEKGKFDPTGLLVMGQSQIDETEFYILDGFKEKIAADLMSEAIVDMLVYWKRIAEKADTHFKAGFESTAYTALFEPLIKAELQRRGLEGYIEIEPLEHGNRAKESRIRMLAPPYSRHWIRWPRKLVKARIGKGQPYDLTEELKLEFCGYPMVSHEELLDCNAYCYELAGNPDYPDRDGPSKPAADPGRYIRKKYKFDAETGEVLSQDQDDEPEVARENLRDGYGDSLGGYDL